MKSNLHRQVALTLAGLILFTTARCAMAGRGGGPPPRDTIGLTNGFIDIDTPDFKVQLVKDSQTLAALQPKGGPEGFDFTPNDRLQARQGDHFYHLGDLTLRVRDLDSKVWTGYSTAAERKPVTALPTSETILAAADLTPTLPADCPLQVTRS